MNWFHNLKISAKLSLAVGLPLSLAAFASLIALGKIGESSALLSSLIQADSGNGHGTPINAASITAIAASLDAGRAMVIAILVISIIVGISTAYIVSGYITSSLSRLVKPIATMHSVCVTSLSEAITALQAGNFTVELRTAAEQLPPSGNDEFGAVTDSINLLVESTQNAVHSFSKTQHTLSSLLTQIYSSAKLVSATSQTLASTTQQIGASTEQISESMREVSQASDQSARGASEVSKGSASQAAAVTEGADLVKKLAAAVHTVARDAKSAESATAEATSAALSGSDSVRETVEGMHEIGKSIAESARVIKTLSDSSKQIGTIVMTIEEIADQTNLLALNAAIEAARAGEAGRGFAVVADEVRKLAERSRHATEEIGGLIAQVQSQTASAVSAMEGGVREVTIKTDIAEKAGKALVQIQSVVSSVATQVKSIAISALEMTASSDEVSRTIADVAAIIEESSAASEQMSASAEEVAASVQIVSGTTAQQKAGLLELVTSADKLAEVSQSLLTEVAHFRLLDAGKFDRGSSESTQSHLRISRAA